MPPAGRPSECQGSDLRLIRGLIADLAVQEEAQRQGCMNKAPAKNAGAFHFNSRGEAAGLHARAFFRKERQQSARNFHRSDAHLKASSGRPL